jgi:hypothetical protein
MPAGGRVAPDREPFALAGLAASGEPVLSFEPGSHDFGLQPVYSSAQASFQLRNEGAEEAWIESLGTAGPDSGSFWVGNSDCWSGPVQPGATCSLEVNFNPGEPFAEYTAQVRARSNGSDFYADLSGTGASPYFSAEPNPVDFGVVAVGSEGGTREIEVVNAGNWPGGVFIAVISGGAVGSFQLLDENCTNRLIAPGEGCTAQVRFRPISTGVKKATLSLFGESDGGSQVTLTGVGAAPDPAPAPSPSAAPATTAAVAPIVVHAAAPRPRAELRERKLRQRLHRKQRIQRRKALRLQRLQRRQRALRRHGRHNRAGLRGRRSIGG